jgi:hypothetical protein
MWMMMALYLGDPAGEEPLIQASYARYDLMPCGDLLYANMKFLMKHSETSLAADFFFERNPSLQLELHRIMLIRHNPHQSS